ncbi:MAG: tetratricopeptide repeat protein [Acidobacteriaceae bacterium]|nr:tetratricopeptide repeat protein [Acidobacteriaceae bacterium]MBV8571825.1 tetratricopeptide repeat protein [Acidobacteriaceae bacterium]
MFVNWTSRSFNAWRRVALWVALLFCMQAMMLAQHGGGAPGGGGGGTGAGAGNAGSLGGAGTRGTTGSIPGLPGTGVGSTAPNTGPPYTRPIFLSGKVVFDDGSPVNANIRIERVCGGNVRLEAHTDSKGRFSFQVGQNQAIDTDASDDAPSMRGITGNSTLNSPDTTGLGRTGIGANPLWNCELRASYPGYLSDMVDLSTRRSLDDPNVGTIILRRAANVKGSTVSLVSAEAPKKAQKNFEKGVQSAQKGDLEQAEKHLQDAVDIYPKYAAAWFALGQVKERANDLPDARKAYIEAATADDKYVSPLDRLALLSAKEEKWQDTADYSKRVIDLNPVEFPSAFWYSAIANFNLKNIDEAQKSATALVKLDTQHKYPEAERMLAQIALSKDDYAGAAAHLRSYLSENPGAKDADSLKQTLLKIDEASAAAKK